MLESNPGIFERNRWLMERYLPAVGQREENAVKSDFELQRDVIAELDWEPSVEAAEIGVSVENGIVTLRGHVKTLTEKWMAERAAQRIDGVHAVTDELRIRLAGDSHRDDTDIARVALNALDWNAAVPADRIKLIVENGLITLEGTVEHRYQKQAAEDAVRNLKGAQGVSNKITVKPRVSPGDVKNQIRKALERTAEVDAHTISVDAKDGNVILRGNVRTLAERDEAERVAWAAPGVSGVQNDIRVLASVVV